MVSKTYTFVLHQLHAHIHLKIDEQLRNNMVCFPSSHTEEPLGLRGMHPEAGNVHTCLSTAWKGQTASFTPAGAGYAVSAPSELKTVWQPQEGWIGHKSKHNHQDTPLTGRNDNGFQITNHN